MFEKAIALDSNYALAHAGLADLFNSYSKEDPHIVSLQVQEIEKAWKIDSANDYILYVKGTIEQTPLGHKDNAFRYFKRGIETNPNNPDNFWGMALLLGLDFGMVDEAKLLFDKTVSLDPLTASNIGLRGAYNFLIGNFENAVKDLQIAIRLEPDYIDGMDALAWIYASTGRLDEAKKSIDKSFQLKPLAADHFSQTFPAYTYIKLGDKKKALEFKPDDWYWLVLLAAGMKEEAIKVMEEGILKGTSNPYLFFKSQLETPDFAIIKNDPRFLRIMEKRQEEYEENKRKYSVMNLVAAVPSQ
jgi:tetratricopeptide (TPR) repeat protein